MAHRLAALRTENITLRHPAEEHTANECAVEHGRCERTMEGSPMRKNRLRRLAQIRFELVQQARARIAAGFYSDEAISACLDELLADLA